MGVAKVQFRSEAMGRQVYYNVLLPEEGEGPFPVLMQLHGLGDSCDSWIQRSNLSRYVADLPLIVVLPDGASSGYLNWKVSGRLHKNCYEDLLMEDIPNHLRRHFNVAEGKWAIGGLSMGGYGAMRLGLKYPERFSSIYGHSSAFHINDMLDPALVEDQQDASCYHHADAIAKREDRPVISFDCGTADELLEHNRKFHEHLQELNIDHHYAEFGGGHEWDYWDLHVREALAQHASVLGLR
jgi:S-formylglutathione hydrolase FrmB